MDISKLIAPKQISQITRLYYGTDHACRCGCCGSYFEPGSRGFKLHMNKLARLAEPAGKVESEDDVPVNIPTDADRDKCVCLYFN